MVTFLEMHGYAFTGTDADVVAEILAVASGDVSEESLADCVRERSSELS